MALAVEPVGWCSGCGEQAMLTLDNGRRGVWCACRASVPESFFAAAGYGRADATSSLERIAAARARGDHELVAKLERAVGR